MTDREKLIEILSVPIYPHELADPAEVVADYLLDNGVTFVTDNNDGSKWIPVTDERKPKQLQECLCVCTFEDDSNWRWQCVLKWHDVPYQDNGIVNRPHFTDEGVHGMVVTHWMPLPKLPKGAE